MIDAADLARLLARHLPRQRWFAAGTAPDGDGGPADVEVAVVELDVLGRPDGPGASPAAPGATAPDPWPALV
ncbi:MAG: sulfite exporter TauE/SafE family protein, partial [Acidimicrobiia bacterium]